jgi:hypothetical protein
MRRVAQARTRARGRVEGNASSGNPRTHAVGRRKEEKETDEQPRGRVGDDAGCGDNTGECCWYDETYTVDYKRKREADEETSRDVTDAEFASAGHSLHVDSKGHYTI